MSARARPFGWRGPAPSIPWRRPRRRMPMATVTTCRPLTTTPAVASAAGSTPSSAPPTNWNQFIYLAKEPADKSKALPTSEAPPHSFTLAIKDNIATLGSTAATTCASHMLQGYSSPFEATVVAQLKARGAVIVGKTNLDEFGMGSHSVYSATGPVADTSSSSSSSGAPALSVGGSSGGSAVAVRLGDADVALGTDTGGSVRLPAAYGGIVGFKPSYGLLSRFGVVPYANSLDTVGLLAADVAPIRQLLLDPGDAPGASDPLWLEADTGRDPTSLSRATRQRLASQRAGYSGPAADGDNNSSRSLAGLVFGIPLEYNIAELDTRIRAAWTAAANRLRAHGATVAAVSLPSTRHALSTYYVLAPAEAASNLARYDGVRYGTPPATDGQACDTNDTDDEGVLFERARGAGLGPEVQQRILLGAYVLSSTARDNYFLQAQRVRRLVVRDFDAVFRLANPLRDHDDPEEQLPAIDLSDLPEGLPLADRRGPAQVDFLLCPTAPTPAPRIADVVAAPSPVDAYINDVFTVPASLAGLPAISIPAPPPSSSATSFCPGLQLIGQFWDDARLLQVAETIMEASFQRPEDREALLHHRKTGVAES